MPYLGLALLLGLNVLVPILVAPNEWYQAIFSYIAVPALTGLLAPVLLGRWHIATRFLIILTMVLLGIQFRLWLEAARAGWDFTYDNEPEVESFLAFLQIAVAAIGFFMSSGLRYVLGKTSLLPTVAQR